jgi:hypothetical protein
LHFCKPSSNLENFNSPQKKMEMQETIRIEPIPCHDWLLAPFLGLGLDIASQNSSRWATLRTFRTTLGPKTPSKLVEVDAA